MEPDIIHTALIEVLQEIQNLSDEECPEITGITKPLEALPKFDSKIWPVAIGMIAQKLEITIANDINIFCKEKNALTIDETVALIIQIAEVKMPISTPSIEVGAK
ncbi:MAG: hypothetical protein ACXV8P_00260 [Methylobacter sp.]